MASSKKALNGFIKTLKKILRLCLLLQELLAGGCLLSPRLVLYYLTRKYHLSKSFLVPQEFADAVANLSAFFLITQATKKVISKLASTGKIAPAKVRAFLNKNKDLYGDKVGKLSLDLDEVLKNEPKFPKESYYSYKNYVTTMGTIGASIVSSNIVTPIVRNSMASDMQKKYLNNRTQTSNGMRV